MPINNLYKILQIEENASQKEIKDAYKRLAKKNHPDKQSGNILTFHLISKAYNILGDQEKRKEYDELLHNEHIKCFTNLKEAFKEHLKKEKSKDKSRDKKINKKEIDEYFTKKHNINKEDDRKLDIQEFVSKLNSVEKERENELNIGKPEKLLNKKKEDFSKEFNNYFIKNMEKKKDKNMEIIPWNINDNNMMLSYGEYDENTYSNIYKDNDMNIYGPLYSTLDVFDYNSINNYDEYHEVNIDERLKDYENEFAEYNLHF